RGGVLGALRGRGDRSLLRQELRGRLREEADRGVHAPLPGCPALEEVGEREMSATADFGMIGLAVMGRNLALNIEDHGFSVAVWNLETPVMEQFVAQNTGKRFVGTKTLKEFVDALEKPRRIMMMIKAGKP